MLALALMAQLALVAGNKITGTVVDGGDNSQLPGVSVMLANSFGDMVKGVATDEMGKFEIADVEDGTYLLHVTYIGYAPQSVSLTNLNGDVNVGIVRLEQQPNVLGEVVVEGGAVINKVDRQIILPTSAQRKASTNGVSLLQHLQIPSLAINPIDKSVKTNFGADVQLRINGVEATKGEVVALRPRDVVRVEYHENPGLRYGSAAAVVDFIVKKNETGGNVATDLMNGIKPLGAGDYNVSARYNRNKSALSAVFSWERRDLDWIRENYESFVYPNMILENKEIGNPTRIKYDNINLSLSYNYADDKNMLNIAFRDVYNNTPNSFSDRNSVLYQGEDVYGIVDRQATKSHIPSLDVYYQRNLGGGQNLYLDVVGTYLKSSNDRQYSMTMVGIEPTSIVSEVDGSKYSVIGEVIYERPLWGGSLTTGAKHSHSQMDNVYDGSIRSNVKMNMEETYLFAEYKSRVKKLDYMVGIGAMRTSYRQGGLSQEKYVARPTLTLSHNVTNDISLRYNAYMSGYSPSLSDLSDVSQEMDAYQVRRGNPGLHSVTFYTNSLSASWLNRYVNVELSGRYSYDDNPIMEETTFEDNKFVRTFANQQGFHRLNVQATVQVFPFRDYIQVRLTPFFNRYVSNGNDYTHTHSNWGFRGSIMAMYKNWGMMIDMNTSYHELWGETVTKGERLHSIAVGYNTEKWGIQAMLMNPFTKRYEQGVDNLSRLAPYKQIAYSDDFRRMVMINVSFNLDFGKQRGISGRRINNSDTDTGILSGSK